MYEIKSGAHEPVNFFAGDFPIVTEVGTVKTGAKISKYMPVIITEEGLTEATAEGIGAGQLFGISADEPTDGGVVCYLTGEYFGEALALPSGVTIEALKPAFRKLGIFLK